MNLITICIDTLRRDHIAALGNPFIKTPNFDKFADRAIIFDDYRLNAIPTIPFRRCFMLGRPVFPFKDPRVDVKYGTRLSGWHALSNDDITFQEALQDAGFVTGIVTDNFHYFVPGMNLHRGFHSWEFIRGQEGDLYRTGRYSRSVDPYLYPPLEGTKTQTYLENCIRNSDGRQCEEDHLPARIFKTATKWLEKNVGFHENFYLYIDCFDPHESWDPPQDYVDLYDPGYSGRKIILPQAGNCEGLTPEELNHIRARYAANVTLVDRWFGYFMEKVYQMGLEEDTIILFLADHGIPLGEHGMIRKMPPAMYPELLDAPMMMKIPGLTGERKHIKGFVQEFDIAPTLLKLSGIEPPEAMSGLDFMPLVKGETEKIRDYAAGGYHTFGYVRDDRYHYFRHLENQEATFLYDVEADPQMMTNIAGEKTHDRDLMEDRLIKALDGWTLPKVVGKQIHSIPYTPFLRQ